MYVWLWMTRARRDHSNAHKTPHKTLIVFIATFDNRYCKLISCWITLAACLYSCMTCSTIWRYSGRDNRSIHTGYIDLHIVLTYTHNTLWNTTHGRHGWLRKLKVASKSDTLHHETLQNVKCDHTVPVPQKNRSLLFSAISLILATLRWIQGSHTLGEAGL